MGASFFQYCREEEGDAPALELEEETGDALALEPVEEGEEPAGELEEIEDEAPDIEPKPRPSQKLPAQPLEPSTIEPRARPSRQLQPQPSEPSTVEPKARPSRAAPPPSSAQPRVVLVSHGQHTDPGECIYAVDVRCFHDPYSVQLRHHDGRFPNIQHRILNNHASAFRGMLQRALQEVESATGTPSVRVAFGCRQGRHRSCTRDLQCQTTIEHTYQVIMF